MSSLFLYFGVLIIGAIAGSKFLSKEKEYKWIGWAQTISVVILVVAMGIRIGSNDEIIASMSTIGLESLVVTAFVMTFSVLFLFLARKFILRANKEGEREHE